jgi:rod shape-determining protein MreC
MESLLHRYRNITVLFVAIIAQLAAVAYQVRRDDNVPLLRIWAVSAVTPVATIIEDLRFGASGVFTDLFSFRGARDESRALKIERDHLRLENQLLKNELTAAQRAGSLAGFKAHTPSKMIGARVIGVTTGMNTRSVLINAGRLNGVRRGMAVVTPDGIVGRVLAEYPYASQVLSVTDADFAASVESQKNHTRGVLKGMGSGPAKVDYVPSGQKVEQGETFFTSGDDRIFPRGMPVGKVISVEDGATFQNIYVEPFVAEAAPEEVFVIVDPIHDEIPDAPPADTPVFLGPDAQATASGAPPTPSNGTQADKVVDQYKKIGAAQNHTFGEGLPGSLPPNFNLKVPGVNAPVGPGGATGGSGVARPKVGGLARGPSGAVLARSATGNLARGASGMGVAKSATGNLARGASGVRVARSSSGYSGARSATGNFARAAAGSSGVVRRIPIPAGASGGTIAARPVIPPSPAATQTPTTSSPRP